MFKFIHANEIPMKFQWIDGLFDKCEIPAIKLIYFITTVDDIVTLLDKWPLWLVGQVY